MYLERNNYENTNKRNTKMKKQIDIAEYRIARRPGGDPAAGEAGPGSN
jgi:hypothetical protein